MSKPDPKVDQRRAEKLFAELLARAQTWIPDWQPTGSERDFGHALLRVAARLSSEVTERLDRTPAKAALGLLDWLGVTRQAGRAARMPVVFKMTDKAADTVFAPARVRIQANVGDKPIAFETQVEVQLVPAPISQMVGVDPDADAIYFPPKNVLSLEPPTLSPTEWIVKSLAATNNKKLQLTPPLGLEEDTIISVDGIEYRIISEPNGDIVTIDPPVETLDIAEGKTVKKVTTFIPFGGTSRNLQEHALYIGDDKALKLSSPQKILIEDGKSLADDLIWEYWGKLGDTDPEWNRLISSRTPNGDLQLEFPQQVEAKSVSIEKHEINGRSNYWIRARRDAVNGSSFSFEKLRLKINCDSQAKNCETAESPAKCCDKIIKNIKQSQIPKLEGVANNVSLVLNERFYPLGKIPRQLDSFYLSCAEAFSKPGAEVCVQFDMADPTLGPLAIVEKWYGNNQFHVYGIGHDGFLHRFLLTIDDSTQKPALKYIGSTRPADQKFTEADSTKAPVVMIQGTNRRVMVWSGNEVWYWDQPSYGEWTPDLYWRSYGTVGDPTEPVKIQQVVNVGAPLSMNLVAIADNSLWYRSADADSWIPIGFFMFGLGDINNSDALIQQLQNPSSIVSKYIWDKIDKPTQDILIGQGTPLDKGLILVEAFNKILQGDSVYDKEDVEVKKRFEGVNFRSETQSLINQNPQKGISLLIRLNRLLLEDAYPSFFWIDRQWDRIVPVMTQSFTGGSNGYVLRESLNDVFFAIDNNNYISRFTLQIGVWTNLETLDFKSTQWATDFSPIAILSGDDDHHLLIASGSHFDKDNDKIVGRCWKDITNSKLIGTDPMFSNTPIEKEVTTGIIHGTSFCAAIGEPKIVYPQAADPFFKTLYLLVTATRSGVPALAWWTPLDADPRLDFDDTPPTLTIGSLSQSPAVVNSFVLIPGPQRDVVVGNFVPLQRERFSVAKDKLTDRMETQQEIHDGDFVKFATFLIKFDPTKFNKNQIDGGDFLYYFTNNYKLSGTQGNLYPKPEVSNVDLATWKDVMNVHTLTLTNPSNEITSGSFLLVEPIDNIGNYILLTVDKPDLAASPPIVTVIDDLSKITPSFPQNTEIEYHLYKLTSIQDFSYQITPTLAFTGNEGQHGRIVKNAELHFLDIRAKPKSQAVKQIVQIVVPTDSFSLAVLSSPWVQHPVPTSDDKQYFAIDSTQSDWVRYTADVATKPDLSWEYWNGSGWWKIEKFDDGTEDLKQTGAIWFEVPSDIQQTEVLGRNSWWIRARLIGGDYGRESFDVVTSDVPITDPSKKGQTQSVVVNTDNVHAPLALGIRLSYSLCTQIAPKYILTFDSKSWLDQSDANRTEGAVVDAFVPVAERLRQLSGSKHSGSKSIGIDIVNCSCSQQSIGTLANASSKTTGFHPAILQSQVKPAENSSVKVLSLTPARNAADAAIDSVIQTVFSEPMDSTSINTSTFQLRDADDVLLPATVTYNADNKIAMLMPDQALAQAQTYTATIRGGSGDTTVSTQSGNPIPADVTWAFTTATSSSRAIYLTFDKEIKGNPIRILFLLEDRNHDQASPMVVEALRNNRFEPVTVEDKTRALGESGLLTLLLDSPPSHSELFGIPGFWLRLRPGNSAAVANWSPCIRGAYVNAVWAEAAETQELEILGSSDGSPLQQMTLTRPPVLRDSLELRIREPLGDEELEQLSKTPAKVKENVSEFPGGRWVLWQEVVDPGDEDADARVYALDPASGQIRFGDGSHGAIPPIGRDAIVAFAYSHGGEASANRVPPFTPLDLVSPIAGVEAALTPDQAAGGSDPEDIQTVRRFSAAKLRHRNRAITLRDLEDLALNHSADIAQVRAFTRSEGIRLVVVMGNRDPNRPLSNRPDPDPSQAVKRELGRYLLEQASPGLARRGALKVEKATRVPFRIELYLRVPSLDVTGSVGKAVKQAIERLFDLSSGGYDGLGWHLGDSPTNDDVAAKLILIKELNNIDAILFSRDVEGTSKTEQLMIQPDQFVWLVSDGITVQFAIEGATV